MTSHTIDFYMDGHKAVSFCKVCSKEGDDLEKPCLGRFEAKEIPDNDEIPYWLIEQNC